MKDQFLRIQVERQTKNLHPKQVVDLVYKLLSNENERVLFAKSIVDDKKTIADLLNISERTVYRRLDEIRGL
jgi:FixJ family two-component response regulator